ncbi:transmembrane protein, putative (macronuclear) [Tetrahymena thermophila SB210]|uniref:Transmembrane protein, putative n=1 Tax=Tetrahymena thermophila (strain SB210) TaxID=312017 RepID=W7XB48_TETTS|nr:transmembrane protein, putative [Tetrahymena thermophila SB210]EWS76605.1 transmembrane protein, putative [Tetrahymena thermophila SB210]|eukprot:XP_012650891.1 transmembrane protein, putative [Tetrahymena thermophila SB210]
MKLDSSILNISHFYSEQNAKSNKISSQKILSLKSNKELVYKLQVTIKLLNQIYQTDIQLIKLVSFQTKDSIRSYTKITVSYLTTSKVFIYGTNYVILIFELFQLNLSYKASQYIISGQVKAWTNY